MGLGPADSSGKVGPDNHFAVEMISLQYKVKYKPCVCGSVEFEELVTRADRVFSIDENGKKKRSRIKVWDTAFPQCKQCGRSAKIEILE